MIYNYISLDSALFKQDGSNFRDLNYLIQILSRQNIDEIARYKFFCLDNDAEVALADMAHFRALTNVDQLLIQEYTNEAMLNGQLGTATRYISNQTATATIPTTFNVTEAIRFFSTPVALVLENSLNDSYFIKAIFKHFGSTVEGTNVLLSFLDSDWITFVNAGGWKNTGNYIEEKKQALQNFAARQMQAPEKYLRHFILIDSDKEYEQYTDGDLSRKQTLSQDLEALGCQVHILQKRAMENYMPDEVVEDLGQVYRSWIDVYKVLSDKQKDYLNYEKGLERKIEKVKQVLPRTEEKEEIKQLYPSDGDDSISDANYSILSNGLKALKIKDFKKEFPKNFWTHHQVYKDSLLNRAGGTEEKNELKDIMNKIISLL